MWHHNIAAIFALNILSDVTAILNDTPTTNAEKLAYILGSSTDALFLDNKDLVNDIENVLDAIYSKYPSIKEDGYNTIIPYIPNYLMLSVTDKSTLSNSLLSAGYPSESEYDINNIPTLDIITGIPSFDTINSNVGLETINIETYSFATYYILRFSNSWINLNELILKYAELKGQINWTEKNELMGDPGINIKIENQFNYNNCGCWTLQFYKGSGDCPAGCILKIYTTCTLKQDINKNIHNIQCIGDGLVTTTTTQNTSNTKIITTTTTTITIKDKITTTTDTTTKNTENIIVQQTETTNEEFLKKPSKSKELHHFVNIIVILIVLLFY